MDLINARENFKDLPDKKTALRVILPDAGFELSSRIDEVNKDLTYVGTAYMGALDTDSKWKIQKILTVGKITTILNASNNFDQVWSNRLGLTYV